MLLLVQQLPFDFFWSCFFFCNICEPTFKVKTAKYCCCCWAWIYISFFFSPGFMFCLSQLCVLLLCYCLMTLSWRRCTQAWQLCKILWGLLFKTIKSQTRTSSTLNMTKQVTLYSHEMLTTSKEKTKHCYFIFWCETEATAPETAFWLWMGKKKSCGTLNNTKTHAHINKAVHAHIFSCTLYWVISLFLCVFIYNVHYLGRTNQLMTFYCLAFGGGVSSPSLMLVRSSLRQV